MNIKTRITITFSLIVGLILLVFSVVIYVFSSEYREEQFFSRLKEKSLTTAKLLFEVDQVDSLLLKIIDRADQTLLFNEKVIIYDKEKKVMYDSQESLPILLSIEQLAQVWQIQEARFTVKDHEVYALAFFENDEPYVVVASAYDKFGYSKIHNLLRILLVCLLLSISLLLLMGRLFARKFLVPISNIVKQVEEINVGSLSIRVYGGTGKDEVAQLAQAFNNMLERLEAAFDIQRDFVSHASHELRTPLTSIIGQIDVALMKPRNAEAYKEVLGSIREDLDSFIDLTNKLLLLAQTNALLPVYTVQDVRADEVLWQARAELLRRDPEYTINIAFRRAIEDDSLLECRGSHPLLRVAFLNLMENACKFSPDHTVMVFLDVADDRLQVDFINETAPFDAGETRHIFDPFYRGTNSRGLTGHGIGLSLVRNIITIHGGQVGVAQARPNLITFTISLQGKQLPALASA